MILLVFMSVLYVILMASIRHYEMTSATVICATVVQGGSSRVMGGSSQVFVSNLIG